MAVTPQTDVYLIKSYLELDNSNQLTFTDKTAQLNYFMSLPKIEAHNFTYQRHDSIIRFPAHIDTILEYNYVVYKNEAYKDKVFYAYITKMEYVNDGLTFIYIKTDVFQTWQFDIIYKKMFVEREHVNNDTVGIHTVPEELETGPYVSNGDVGYLSDFQLWAYMVNVTSDTSGNLLGPSLIGSVASAGAFYVFKGAQDESALYSFIQSYNAREDAIVNVYLVPFKLVEGKYNTSTHRLTADSVNVTRFDYEMNKPTSINGYTPVNKKLLTNPYQYLLVTNNAGNNNILHYERFTGAKAEFDIMGSPNVGASIKLVPKNYLGANQEEGLIMGKYPTCSWSNDMFVNWLTQNAVNVGLSLAGGGATLLGGLVTGNPLGVVGGGTAIASTLGQVYQHSFTPPSASGNTNGGDVLTSMGYNTFLFYPMSIKQEYAKIIDDFMSAYGYKVNSYKIPNITGRRNWNYVKTIGCNIEGHLPQPDLQEIKGLFNAGVTLWHNPATFLDYSQNNAII